MKIQIDIEVLVEALVEIIRIDEISSKKSEVGYNGKYSVKDIDMLTIACLSFHAYSILLEYLSEQDKEEVIRLISLKRGNKC